ncbi:MAG: L,D-peptidoglycan transpeptidase YkuD (ErfK/YbiS/YcfS/YnhG family) [Alteromonas macleodii]|jgi:L,D-peptidoglycan transpeptidase YkuD (ErfK/YbiS/YcfS/YnhG family)
MKSKDLVITPSHLRFMNRRFPCSIGRGDITSHKTEGDGATPRGTHRLVGMLYRPDRMAKPTNWALPIHPGDLWSDDQTHEDYNMMVRAPYKYSFEKLRRADPLYDLVILTNWNWPYPVKGRGSAIFIHRWRKLRHPTEGCIGLSMVDLAWIAPRIQYSTRLIVL